MFATAILEHILAEIGVKATSEGASRLWATLQRFPIWGKSQYIAELRAAISQMPFIYHDLPLELLGNFVDTDLALTRRDAFEGRSSSDRAPSLQMPSSPLRLLQPYRKFVLLGDAGMGKTTLFRYAALSVTERRTQSQILYATEKPPVPILVPLKALHIADEFPVLAYIQRAFPYFEGEIGLARLSRLAKQTRLLLLLDGYDEIPIAGGITPFRRELRLLYSHSKGDAEVYIRERSSNIISFYSAFVGNRVGLTSRVEFYFAHPLDLPLDTFFLKTSGVGESRIRLVANIFDRYRRTGGEYSRENLNEEVFMQGLITAGRESLQRVSTNPLFLTVMCYVYVNAITQQIDPSQIWRQGELALIDKCIELLLVDIDKYKARGLPSIEQRALTNRRGAFSDEKKAFLRYIAAHVVLEKDTVLTKDYLVSKAKLFFSKHDSPNSPDILAGLSTDDPTANLVLQIIFCGVLVLTQGGFTLSIQDFPHRRFREVLAADHFNSAEGARILAAHATDQGLYEFLLLYADRNPDRIEPILRAVRNDISRVGNGYAQAKLLGSLVQKVRDQDKRSSVVEELIFEVAPRSAGKMLPRSLLQHLLPSENLMNRLDALLIEAKSQANASVEVLAGEPLRELRDPSYKKRRALHESTRAPSSFLSALEISQASNEKLVQFLAETFPSKDIDSVSPGWATAIYWVMQSSKEKARLRSVITSFFGLDRNDEVLTHKITELDEKLLAIGSKGDSFRVRENSSFTWVDD
jgi:hypothetical protein